MTIGLLDIARPDVTLRLDNSGTIRMATLASAFNAEAVDRWIGRPWIETVDDVGADKISRIVKDATVSGVSAFRQVTQRFPSGLEVPMEYTAVCLGEEAGLIAVGKNLQSVAELHSRLIAAQRTMEQDYWKLRHIETRYRLLFDNSVEAILLLRATDYSVVEANPVAMKALGISPVGRDFLLELPREERDQFAETLRRVRDRGSAPGILVRLGEGRDPWLARVTLMTSNPGPDFLVQLTPAGLPRHDTSGHTPTFEKLFDRLPDGFALIDSKGRVLRANGAFLELLQSTNEEQVVGKSLHTWLGRPGADLRVLLENVARHHTITGFPTVIQGNLGAETEVEISACGDESGNPALIGVLVRNASRRLPTNGGSPESGPLLDAHSEIGRIPLKKVVSETVDRVERSYIRAALDLASENRTAAAELLGMSRQSLYQKMRQYGLDDRSNSPG